MIDELTQDLDLYKLMSDPYATNEEADAAIDAFLNDVVDLRKKHRIANIVVCVHTNRPGGHRAVMISRGESSIVAMMATQLYRRFAVPLLRSLAPTEDEG